MSETTRGETPREARRVLIAARLSRQAEGQTGIERQDEAAQAYADQHGYVTVATVADSGVSGGTDPFKRPALGPWLTDVRHLSRYDELVASNIDRLGRNARDLSKLRDWAEDHGKRLTLLSPRLHWPPAEDDFASPIVWDILGRLAEYELKAIKRRYADMQRYLKENNYLVGKPPFGYMIIAKDDHKTLAPDPALIPYVRGIVERYLAGETLAAICEWLDASGVSPVHGGKWAPKSVSQLLRNPILTGRRKAADSDGRKGKGKTDLRIEPVIELSTFRQLQRALDDAPTRRGAASADTAILTNVLVCGTCGGPMYRFRATNTRKDGTKQHNWYYRCNGTPREPSTCKNMIPLDQIEQYVSDQMTGEVIGSDEVIERTVIPGEGYADQIEQLEEDIRELDLDAPDFLQRQAALLTERKRLQDLPSEPDRIIERRTGVTVADHWRSLSDAGKRAYLLDSGAKVYAVRVPEGQPVDRETGYPRLAASIALQRT